MVEATGFEPAASASRTQRSTKLSHASNYILPMYYKELTTFCQDFMNISRFSSNNIGERGVTVNNKDYDKLVKKKSPPSKKARDFVCAFLIGGTICTIGQLLRELLLYYGVEEKKIGMIVSAVLIALAGVLTGFKLFEKIAKHAGAGTLVPITGFANAVISPAIEFKPEGFVLGVGAKMFVIAGPVIVYGTVASALYGLIYWLMKMI